MSTEALRVAVARLREIQGCPGGSSTVYALATDALRKIAELEADAPSGGGALVEQNPPSEPEVGPIAPLGAETGCRPCAPERGISREIPQLTVADQCSREGCLRLTRVAIQPNACLIAAAPELYEALERILRAPINGVPLRDWEDYNVKEAIGILAKARGEKPRPPTSIASD